MVRPCSPQVSFSDISVIIPVAGHEPGLKALFQDLEALSTLRLITSTSRGTRSGLTLSERSESNGSKEMEIIIAKPERGDNSPRPPLILRGGGRGRAIQMNTGAERATRPFLWFLHADTRLPPTAGNKLLQSLNRRPDSLHYFGLKFWDGSRLMRINEIGCWVRSRLMGVPFGDQGFCLKKEIFGKLGGFPENAPYGEDHLLVWRARQNGIRPACTGTFVSTSARRYMEEGWLRLTFRYAFRWTRQAWPEWRKGVLS